ncbi:MAG: hypothetical protein JWN44_4029 [Myxococcales bacterium]|nr:hypothetical protein [Myxococcales bacterium]
MRAGAVSIFIAVLTGCAGQHEPGATSANGIPSPTGDGGSDPMTNGVPDSPAAPPLLGNGASSGVVSFVSVTSDRVADVSSLEAWQRAFIHDGMSDADKADAIWRSVVAFRHQEEPGRELIEWTGHPHDPIKLFNVYGYSQCDCASAALSALGRSVGLDARQRPLTNHTVAELYWSGGWHMLDAAYIDWFPRPDKSLATVDELTAATSGWLASHPDLAGNRAGLLAFMSGGGWRNGPPLLAASPYYDSDGLFPARVQGWADTMLEYPGTSSAYEYGYTLGYRVNVQLRRGEKLVRNWFNDGHHVNDDRGISCDTLTAQPGAGQMAYSPAYGDLAPGRIGNGTHAYVVPLAGGDYRGGALAAENLADAAAGGAGPLVRVADPTKPAVLIVRMASSYLDLSGALQLTAVVPSGGAITVAFSRNHGLDWQTVATIAASGARTIDLSPWVRRQYDYRVRIQLEGDGTGLDALAISDVVQHSQRALPALAVGDNAIHVTTGASGGAGSGPGEGTITLDANTDSSQTLNRVYTEYHPLVDGLLDTPLQPTGASGAITFPVATPGDLSRLRFGTFYRARAAADHWDYAVSFDQGQSFTTVDRAAGPTVGAERFVTFDRIPPGTRAALVRFAGAQVAALDIFDFRIDADYVEPVGGFAPIVVTYEWTENGQPRSDRHVIHSLDERYTIHCDATPVMRSLTVARADER